MKDGMESSGSASESMDAAADDMVDCAAQSFCDGVVLVVTDLGAKSVQVWEGGELCRARLAPFYFFLAIAGGLYSVTALRENDLERVIVNLFQIVES